MAGIKDVAKQAKVGVATVSRALNGSGYVSEDARKKIDKAIKELNYTPNELARNLYRNRSGIIGVVIPDLEHPFFAKLSKYIEMELYEKGYKTMICNTVGISNRERDYLDMLDRSMVDGIITGSHSLEDHDYLSISKPIIALDRDFGGKIPLIHSDHKKGGRLAAEIMIKSGCKDVIQFAGFRMVQTPAHQRHVEFERICKEHGIRVTTIETAWNEFDYEYYKMVAQKYLSGSREYDGVFSADGVVASCMNVLKKQGRKVPQDVCVVGYDGVGIGMFTNPPLTSIKQDIEQLAKCCVDTMIQMIEEKPYEAHQILDVSVEKGGTVRYEYAGEKV